MSFETSLVEPEGPTEYDDPLLPFDADPSVFRATVTERRFRLEPEQALVAPVGWRERRRVPSSLELNFTVAVRLVAQEQLLIAAADARNPTSHGYGRFLRARAAAALAPANASSLGAVLAWLKDYMLAQPLVRGGGAFVSFSAPAGAWQPTRSTAKRRTAPGQPRPPPVQAPHAPHTPTSSHAGTAERMLGCRFWHFEAANGAMSLRAYTPYALRADVADAVDFVAGVLRLPGDGTASASSWVPSAYATRHATPVVAPPPPPLMSSVAAHEMARQRAAILRLLEGAASPGNVRPPIPALFAGAEADGALEYVELASRVAPMPLQLGPAAVVTEPLVELLAQLSEADEAPRVWELPPLNPPSAALRHARRLEAEFARLGARGFTLLAPMEDASESTPRYPACSPHVTLLPATRLSAVAAMTAAVNSAREGSRLAPLGPLSGWLPPEAQELACDRSVLLNNRTGPAS